jgi:hypothetical protein
MLLLWAFIGYGNNVPYGRPDLPDDLVETVIDGRRVAIYDVESSFGFPFQYHLSRTPAKITTSTTQVSNFWLVVNMVLVTLTLISIVLTVQTWFPRFSVRAFLFGVFLVACLLTLGIFVFKSDVFLLQATFVYSLFFSPLISGGFAFKSIANAQNSSGAGLENSP